MDLILIFYYLHFITRRLPYPWIKNSSLGLVYFCPVCLCMHTCVGLPQALSTLEYQLRIPLQPHLTQNTDKRSQGECSSYFASGEVLPWTNIYIGRCAQLSRQICEWFSRTCRLSISLPTSACVHSHGAQSEFHPPYPTREQPTWGQVNHIS
jgi:hypothetical protein